MVLQIEAWDFWLSKLTTSLWEVRKKQDSLNCLGKKSRSARNLNELTGLLQNDVPHMPKPPWWSLTMLQHKPERKVAGNIWEPSSFCGISIRKAAAFTLIPNLSSECTPESTQRSSQLAKTQFLGRWPVLDSKHTSGANRTNPKVQRSVTWFQGSYCLHCFSVKHNQLATGKIIVCQQCWPHASFWRCYLLCQLGPHPTCSNRGAQRRQSALCRISAHWIPARIWVHCPFGAFHRGIPNWWMVYNGKIH